MSLDDDDDDDDGDDDDDDEPAWSSLLLIELAGSSVPTLRIDSSCKPPKKEVSLPQQRHEPPDSLSGQLPC